MSGRGGPSHWVFHRGALGDSVLLWPMLRARRHGGQVVSLVTDAGKAQLAARELGIAGIDAEQRRFNSLWVPDADVDPRPEVAEVTAFVGPSPGDDAGFMAIETYRTNLRAMFPRASIELVQGRPDAAQARRWAAHLGGTPRPRINDDGPIVMHIGAGSPAKRWPLDRFALLADDLASIAPVRVIAGEVERERLTAAERAAFAVLGGMFIDKLAELAALLASARLFVGVDSGPAHLSGQLGVATLALFGPTDPARWSPVGPRVACLAPAMASPMDWLSVEAAKAAARATIEHGVQRSRLDPAQGGDGGPC